MLGGGHGEVFDAGDRCVETGDVSGCVLGDELAPEFGAKADDEVHAAGGGTRLADGGDGGDEGLGLLWVEKVEFEIGVGGGAESKDAGLGRVHGGIITSGLQGRVRVSGALDDDDGLVVDEGLVAFETQCFVLNESVLHDGVADGAGWIALVSLQDGFKRLAAVGIGAVVDAVGVEDEDVAGVDEVDLGDVFGEDAPIAEVHREIAAAIGMVGGELEAEGEELRHVVVMDGKEARAFCRKDEGWRVTEIGEAEVASGMDFAIEHGGNFTRLFGLAHAERVACGAGLREAEVEVLEEARGGPAVAVELGKHEGLERVVDGGGDFGGDDAVAFGVDEEDACGGVELVEILGDAELLGAAREAVLGFHFGAVVGASLEPLDEVVDGVADGGAGGKGLEVFDGELFGAGDARIDVVTLLEVDVFEQVAADRAGGDGRAKHLDAGNVRNGTFDGHESLAQVFVDGWSGVGGRHGRGSEVEVSFAPSE